jgi:hypothetical protein
VAVIRYNLALAYDNTFLVSESLDAILAQADELSQYVES